MKKEEYNRITARLSPYLRKELLFLWGKDAKQEERIISLLKANKIDVRVEKGEKTRGWHTGDLGIPVECTRFTVPASDLGRAQKLLQRYNKIINPRPTRVLIGIRTVSIFSFVASMGLSPSIRWFDYIIYLSIAGILIPTLRLMRRDDDKYLIASCGKCGSLNRLHEDKINNAKCGRCGKKLDMA